MFIRFVGLMIVTILLLSGCANTSVVPQQPTNSDDPVVGLLSRRIVQLTVNMNGLSKRMSDLPPPAAGTDPDLQELRTLNLSGWQLHQRQWSVQHDRFVLARELLQQAHKSSEDKSTLLGQWKVREQEYVKALADLRRQRQLLEETHLQLESQLIERGLR